jgi:hypothetical protein
MLAKERNEVYNKLFNTPEGKKVIDDLCKQHYIHNSTYNRDGSEYETVYREGQRRVVLRILNILKKETE